MVQEVVSDSADDVRGTDNIPLGARFLAVRRKEVFLRIVEVILQSHPRIGLKGGAGGWTDVESIVFGAGLEQEPFWREVGQPKSPNEVLDQ